jgi:hypothetical protein
LQRCAVDSSQEHDVPPIVHEVLRSSGQPLDTATREFMEPRFGHDFSRVRVHTNTKAAESARMINALAYTAGRDLVFGADQYAPGTVLGRSLLAHELSHVVQQENSEVSSQALVAPSSSPAEAEASRISSGLDSSPGPARVTQRTAADLALTPVYKSASTGIIDIEGTVADIERWEQGLAGSVAESNIGLKILGFVPFFFLDLLKRSVQLGNLLFGVTELQHSADVIFDTTKSAGQRIKAGLWAAFNVAMSLMMVGGIAERVGLAIGGAVRSLGRIKWIASLRTAASQFIEQAFAAAKETLPLITQYLSLSTSVGKRVVQALVAKVTGTKIWQKLVEWSSIKIPLPRAVEALSEDLFVTMGRLFGLPAPELGVKAGIGAKIAEDVKLADTARDLAARYGEGSLQTATRAAKGEVGEQAGRLITRLQGWTLTEENLSKLGSNQGIDILLTKSGRQFFPGALEAKATSSTARLSRTTVRAGDPLAQLGVPVGTSVQQASRGFNIDRLFKLLQSGDPEKWAAANIFLSNLARLEDLLAVTRLTPGTVALYRLEMTANLLGVAHMREILRLTFGEIKGAYYILVAAEVSPFAVKTAAGAGRATEREE